MSKLSFVVTKLTEKFSVYGGYPPGRRGGNVRDDGRWWNATPPWRHSGRHGSKLQRRPTCKEVLVFNGRLWPSTGKQGLCRRKPNWDIIENSFPFSYLNHTEWSLEILITSEQNKIEGNCKFCDNLWLFKYHFHTKSQKKVLCDKDLVLLFSVTIIDRGKGFPLFLWSHFLKNIPY